MRSKVDIKEDIFNLIREYSEVENNEETSFEIGDRIPYAKRVFDAQERLNLVDSALEFWLTSGRYCNEFEKKLGEFLNVPYVYAVNSGSSANLLAFMALTSPLLKDRAINRGDEVITVAAGFPTTVTPILQYGAVPVFVDVTIPEYNIDISKMEGALSSKTKAVMIAHTLGMPFDLEYIVVFCKKHNLWLIEDNCDALGSEYLIDNEMKKTGSIGDIGTSSFYPAHHMTMGEGGAVYTSNPLLSKIILSMRDWGRDCTCPSGHDDTCNHRFQGQYGQLPKGYDHKYVYSHLGYNLKITEMQGAIGVAQLDKLQLFIDKRKEHFDILMEGLKESSEYLLLPKILDNVVLSPFGFLCGVRENIGVNRNDLVDFLEKRGIQTRNLFSGNIILHPCFDNIRGTDAYRVYGNLENTNFVMNNVFWVGVYPGLTSQQLQYMITSIKEGLSFYLEKNSKGE